MRYILLILLFAISVSYAQFIPHEATLTASKDSIMSDETFTVTYSLTGVQGHVYIGLKWGFFEPIGSDRWDGIIKLGDTKTVTFTVRLKENAKKWVHKKVPLDVGFSYKPFGKRVLDGVFSDVYVNLIDFKEITSNIKLNEQLRKTSSTQNVALYPVSIKVKTYLPDPFSPKAEYFTANIPKHNFIKNSDNFSDLNTRKVFNNSFKLRTKNNNVLTSYTIEYSASYVSYSDASNYIQPWQYYTVEILGLQSPNDQNPVVLAQQIISASSTGGFDISTTLDYPYYQCVLALEGPVYLAFEPDANWNGSNSTNISEYGIGTQPMANPYADSYITINDPDITDNSDLQKVLNICSDISKGYTYVKNKSNYSPGPSLVFFNSLISTNTIGASFTTKGSINNINYPTLYITDHDWNLNYVVLHEYGHAIQILVAGGLPPEGGGTHALGIRYNPQLAFAEGWAHFFAAAVTSNPAINPAFNLSANPPYSQTLYPYHNYTPITQFEGSCDEVMVASLLWEMFSKTNNNYNYMQEALSTILPSYHKPYNIFEFIKNHKLYYDPGNGAGYWIRADQDLRIGAGINYVNSGGSIQNAINSSSNHYIVYVSQSINPYSDNLNISDKAIGLFGEAPINTIIKNAGGTSEDVIDINNSGSGYCMINGFTIENGNAGINVSANSKAYISDNIIRAC